MLAIIYTAQPVLYNASPQGTRLNLFFAFTPGLFLLPCSAIDFEDLFNGEEYALSTVSIFVQN